MGVSKTSDHIKINIKMPNPSQEPPASSKVTNEDLKDMDVLCSFKIKWSKIWYMGVPKTSGHIQIKIQMPNPIPEPPAYSKAPNEDLKDMDVLCNFKIKIESHKLDYWCIKQQLPCLNQDKDAKPQSGTSSILQSPKWGLKGHASSLHLQN